jgi:hypothetical protein
MVVDGHGEDGLGAVLAHRMLIQVALDGAGPEVVEEGGPRLLVADWVVGENLSAEFDTLVADGRSGDPCGELPEVSNLFGAEGAAESDRGVGVGHGGLKRGQSCLTRRGGQSRCAPSVKQARRFGVRHFAETTYQAIP